MLARFGRLDHVLGVQGVGRGDEDAVHPRVGEEVAEAAVRGAGVVLVREGLGALLIAAIHADQLGAVRRGHGRGDLDVGVPARADDAPSERHGVSRDQAGCSAFQSRSAITPTARSTASAASRIMSSRKRRPTIWTPTGWPLFSLAGTTAAGRPMKFMA